MAMERFRIQPERKRGSEEEEDENETMVGYKFSASVAELQGGRWSRCSRMECSMAGAAMSCSCLPGRWPGWTVLSLHTLSAPGAPLPSLPWRSMERRLQQSLPHCPPTLTTVPRPKMLESPNLSRPFKFYDSQCKPTVVTCLSRLLVQDPQNRPVIHGLGARTFIQD